MTVATQGDNLSTLPGAILEYVRPGKRAELVVGLKAEIDQQAVDSLQTQLNAAGMRASVEFGSTADWENALRIRFVRPKRQPGVSMLPDAVLFVGALGAIGIVSILGFKLGDAVEALANHMPMILFAIGATVVGLAVVKEMGRQNASRTVR